MVVNKMAEYLEKRFTQLGVIGLFDLDFYS